MHRTVVSSSRLRLACSLALLAGGQLALAAEPATPSTTRFSGFGTLGVSSTHAPDDAVPLRDPSGRVDRPTSTMTDSRLGLQVNWAPTRTLEAVAQVVLRPRPQGARLGESLEWAFLSWRPDEMLQVRLGRMAPDIFLHSDVRSVGFALPWVRPNIDYYGVIPYNSIDGADLTWRMTHEDGASTRVRAMAGQSSMTMRGSTRTSPSTALDTTDLLGLTVSHERADLLMRATYMTSKLAVDMSLIAPLSNALQQLASIGMPGVSDEARALDQDLIGQGKTRYISLAAQWDSGPWLVHAEVNRIDTARGLASGTRGYLSVAHRLGTWQPFAMISRSQASRAPFAAPTSWAASLTPVVGAAQAQQAAGLGITSAAVANTSRFHQQTLSAGVRWDFHPRVAWKLQLDHFRVGEHGAGLWGGMPPAGGRANMISTTLDTVF